MSANSVWSLPQRLLHWGLVIALGLSWWSGTTDHDWHARFGYAVAALLAARLLLGITSRHSNARWDRLLSRLRQLPAYLASGWRRPPTPPLGHSPTGAVSVIILLSLTAATALSGWLLTWEDFVGEEWLETLHYRLFQLLQFWVALHLLAILTLSYLQRHNKIRDMLNGGQQHNETTSTQKTP